jgi:hypothetical protein
MDNLLSGAGYAHFEGFQPIESGSMNPLFFQSIKEQVEG